MVDTEIEVIAAKTKRYCDHFGYKCTSSVSSSDRVVHHLDLISHNCLSFQTSIRDDIRRRIFASSFKVNEEHFDLRCKEDLFGRRITELRKSLTNQDNQPFETA